MKIVRSSSRTCSARFAPGQNQLLANLSLLLFFKDLSIVRFYDFKKNFRGMCFTVQLSKIGFALPFVSNSFAIISCRFLPVKNFFQLFLKLFLFLSCSNFDILSHPTGCCQELFSFLFDSKNFNLFFDKNSISAFCTKHMYFYCIFCFHCSFCKQSNKAVPFPASHYTLLID